jgi:two-component system nitrogen regulation response regulator NtrX
VPSVLIIDDEANIRRMVGALLQSEGYDVREAASGTEGLKAIADEEPDVTLLDLMMPGELNGIATLERVREHWRDLPVVMMSGRASLSDAVHATKLGAVNFLEKPLAPETVLLALSSALELRQSRRTTRALREELGLTGQMVGSSAAMAQVREIIGRVALTDARVLISGESGTGKELVAAAIHDKGARRDRPLVRVNCAAIPRDLVESEMFGHEKGAFTGATTTRVGRFELAHTGTLFLDEIGDLTTEAQAKLLRAIEAKEIQRVGGNKTIRVDVRVIAATNKDLARAVADGTFREDLYFRLNVIPIELPPLRERDGDTVELIHHFSRLQHQRTGRPLLQWSEGALARMQAYPWPGNVRELANIVERIAILNTGTQVREADVMTVLPHAGTTVSGATASGAKVSGTTVPGTTVPGASGSGATTFSTTPFHTASHAEPRALADALDETERRLIRDALARANGSVAEAARQLQTDRPNLYRRMKRLGITVALLLTAALPVRLQAQTQTPASDTTPPITIPDVYGSSSPQHLGLGITSGKVYNRVEGFPIKIGPVYSLTTAPIDLQASAYGIIRTGRPLRFASPDGGYDASLNAFFGSSRQFSAGIRLYNVVAPIERWQLSEPEAGLAAFLLHRDYFDYYARHGAGLSLGWQFFPSAVLTAGYATERWNSIDLHDPFTVFRNDQAWRPNPGVDEGVMHLFTLAATFDTRNDVDAPSGGWYLRGTYEYGHSSALTRTMFFSDPPITRPVSYGRIFFDLRRYNRLSPRIQLNGRVVFGGWVQGDELPLERKLSVGGPGTLPGYDFRKVVGPSDVQLCQTGPILSPDNPAQCDRVLLSQFEFRTELARSPFAFSNIPFLRLRHAGFTANPVGVLFTDIGRGWRTTQDWSHDTKADVGAGVDLGLLGLYVAKSVTDWSEAANFFIRIKRRF